MAKLIVKKGEHRNALFIETENEKEDKLISDWVFSKDTWMEGRWAIITSKGWLSIARKAKARARRRAALWRGARRQVKE